MIDHRVQRPSPTRAAESPEDRLARLKERYRHELMGEEERCELWGRIAAAMREIALTKAGR